MEINEQTEMAEAEVHLDHLELQDQRVALARQQRPEDFDSWKRAEVERARRILAEFGIQEIAKCQ